VFTGTANEKVLGNVSLLQPEVKKKKEKKEKKEDKEKEGKKKKVEAPQNCLIGKIMQETKFKPKSKDEFSVKKAKKEGKDKNENH
jgi:hypothetical protein